MGGVSVQVWLSVVVAYIGSDQTMFAQIRLLARDVRLEKIEPGVYSETAGY